MGGNLPQFTTLPYQLSSLTWAEDGLSNVQSKYCYCGQEPSPRDIPMVRCESCRQYFHSECIKCLPIPLMYSDVYYKFTCSVCGHGTQHYSRVPMKWIQVVLLVLTHLTLRCNKTQVFFRWKEDICKFIEAHWKYLLPEKNKGSSWMGSVSSTLSINETLFQSGFSRFHTPGWWGLSEYTNTSSDASISMNLDNSGRCRQRRVVVGDESKPSASIPQSPSSQISSKSSPKRSNKRSNVVAFGHDSDSGVTTIANTPLTGSPVRALELADSPVSGNIPDPKRKVSRARRPPGWIAQESETVSGKVALHRQQPPLIDPIPLPSPCPDMAIDVVSHEVSDVLRAQEREKEKVLLETIRVPLVSPDESLALIRELDTLISNAAVKSVLRGQMESSVHSVNQITVAVSAAMRLRRRLILQRTRRTLRYKSTLDLDGAVLNGIMMRKDYGEGGEIKMANVPAIQASQNWKERLWKLTEDDKGRLTAVVWGEAGVEKCLKERYALASKLGATPIPFTMSYARHVEGDAFLRDTLTMKDPWESPYTGNPLQPYIWRDRCMRPPMKRLLEWISLGERPVATATAHNDSSALSDTVQQSRPPIDFAHLQRMHVDQINDLLSRLFWPGIDVSEHLQYPDYSVVALYKRLVVGCALMTPEGYITYVMVRPGWNRSGIARFMVYHLLKSNPSRDVTLHVSANNPAMILYQSFGFKAEEFIINFYDKYLPAESSECKNALFVRLRR